MQSRTAPDVQNIMADQLSDKELRQELLGFGEKSIGPITATTRSIYVKKLNHLRARQHSQATPPARKVASKKLLGFSSDESDDEISSSRGAKRVPTKSKSIVLSNTAGSVASKRTKQRSRQANDAFTRPAHNAASDVRSPNSPTPVYNRRSLRQRPAERSATVAGAGPGGENHITPNRRSLHDSLLDPAQEPSRTAPHTGFANNSYVSNGSNRSSRILNRTFELSDSDDVEHSEVNDSDNHESVIMSPEMMSKSMNTSAWLDETYASNSSYQDSVNHSAIGSPLSSRNHDSVNALLNRSIIDKSKLRCRASMNKTPLNTTRTDAESLLAFRTAQKPLLKSKFSWDFKQNISTFLLVLAAFFFIMLAFMYVNIKGNAAINMPGLQLAICRNGENNTESSCLDDNQADVIMSQVEDISNMLSIRAGEYDCGVTGVTRNMTIAEIKRKMVTKGYQDIEWNSIIHLIKNNPSWQISVQWRRWLAQRETDERHIETLEAQLPNMSLWCRVKKSAHTVFKVLCFIFTASLLVTIAIGLLRMRWLKIEQQKLHVYQLVEKIIDILKTHHDACEENTDMKPYLAIPHVRDMIIAPSERSAQQALWDRAVKFLSANESRVREETQKISGEEFAVWRWLQVNQNGKVWQGQAFGEYHDSGLNTPPCSSMPCLKIRNMFDADVEYGEDWHVYIQDAILEKCGLNHGVIHIAVDKNSKEGCVYVKFATAEAAGRAFKALHGWWFDRSLVTVKYLRLERYHERFPDVANISTPMRPSNTQQQSLAQQATIEPV